MKLLTHEVASGTMREFELALVSAFNSFERWVTSCAQAAGETNLAAADMMVLRMISNGSRPKRAVEISFALNIEDTYLVSYALKKLIRLGYAESHKNGKEALFVVTAAGQAYVDRYHEIRASCLIETLQVLTETESDLAPLTRRLRAISGIYEQAARSATAL